MEIYKYELPVTGGTFKIAMHEGARVLKLGVQGMSGARQMPVMWVLCDPDKVKTDYSFVFFGTGIKIPKEANTWKFEKLVYLDTLQLGQFVWHYFQIPK